MKINRLTPIDQSLKVLPSIFIPIRGNMLIEIIGMPRDLTVPEAEKIKNLIGSFVDKPTT